MAKAMVKCKVCGGTFDRLTEETIKVSARRYAHASCAEGLDPSEEEQDLIKLHAYLKQLFKGNYNYVVLNKQIETFVKTNEFSYSGILKSLIYWYEIKQNSLEKAGNRIGIVPYIYEEAKQYYLALFLANQQNEGKDLNDYKEPETIEVRIKPPKKAYYGFRLFNLDD